MQADNKNCIKVGIYNLLPMCRKNEYSNPPNNAFSYYAISLCARYSL